PSGRSGHVQGADLPHDRRRGDLGLRRRHASGDGPLRWQRRSACPRRLRGQRASLRRARRVPHPRRADRPPRPEGHRPAACPRRLRDEPICADIFASANDVSFGAPEFLWLLLLVPACAAWAIRGMRRRDRTWQALGPRGPAPRGRSAWLLAAATLLILAMARP